MTVQPMISARARSSCSARLAGCGREYRVLREAECHAGLCPENTYLAGQVSGDEPTVKGQTEAVLKKIDDLLASAGTTKSKLLSATFYIADIKTFDEMNAAWDAWVVPGNTPARATVEVKLANPKYRVEISAIAAVD